MSGEKAIIPILEPVDTSEAPETLEAGDVVKGLGDHLRDRNGEEVVIEPPASDTHREASAPKIETLSSDKIQKMYDFISNPQNDALAIANFNPGFNDYPSDEPNPRKKLRYLSKKFHPDITGEKKFSNETEAQLADIMIKLTAALSQIREQNIPENAAKEAEKKSHELERKAAESVGAMDIELMKMDLFKSELSKIIQNGFSKEEIESILEQSNTAFFNLLHRVFQKDPASNVEVNIMDELIKQKAELAKTTDQKASELLLGIEARLRDINDRIDKGTAALIEVIDQSFKPIEILAESYNKKATDLENKKEKKSLGEQDFWKSEEDKNNWVNIRLWIGKLQNIMNGMLVNPNTSHAQIVHDAYRKIRDAKGKKENKLQEIFDKVIEFKEKINAIKTEYERGVAAVDVIQSRKIITGDFSTETSVPVTEANARRFSQELREPLLAEETEIPPGWTKARAARTNYEIKVSPDKGVDLVRVREYIFLGVVIEASGDDLAQKNRWISAIKKSSPENALTIAAAAIGEGKVLFDDLTPILNDIKIENVREKFLTAIAKEYHVQEGNEIAVEYLKKLMDFLKEIEVKMAKRKGKSDIYIQAVIDKHDRILRENGITL